MLAPLFVTSIFHPTDFSDTSDLAFAHALALAVLCPSDLTILHASRDFLAEDEWSKFPPVRRTLEAWGCLEPGSPSSAVLDHLAVRVKKVSLRGRPPAAAIVHYLAEHDVDLIVLATEGRDGLPGWLAPSVAERVAREAKLMTLFVPQAGRGFVHPSEGTIDISRVLVPIAHEPDGRSAVAYGARVARLAGSPAELVLLHVGEGSPPAVEKPQDPALRYREEQRRGDVIDEIERAAREMEVDLIAMATDGRDGFLGVMGRGSHTEQVVRRAPCPVLTVPALRE